VSFGRELQLERVRRDISLEAIAEGTKVPTRHLRALEQEQYEQLPGGVFTKGIVRSYCRHLGLDEQEWLQRFPAIATEPEPDWAEFAENIRRNRVYAQARTRRRWIFAILMLLTLAALAWAAWTYVLQPRIAAVPDAATSALTLPAGTPSV
jgi:cytoskeletal protein RodZ